MSRFLWMLSAVVAVTGSTLIAGGLGEESRVVTIVGSLRAHVVAIGGETTGMAVKANGVSWELDFGKHTELKKAAEKLDGQRITVTGTLEHRTGVEVGERFIITVSKLQVAQ